MKMKKVLALLLSLCLVVSAPVAVFAADFSDTEDHWAESSIDRWSSYGILNGKGGDIFDPNAPMKRGEAATIFANLLGLTETADISQFGDVSADDWYAEALAKCVAAGIMNGVGDDMMDPEGTITREMFFTMFARALGIRPQASTDENFDDADEVSDWAEGYINALINEGYVDGLTDTEIAPDVNINRASVAALLDKTVKQYVTEEGAVVDASEGGLILVAADNVKIENAPEG
ncbi:MAG: S-layer homology domain-containing protein, partial [Firmicutes bacterium]|nr:S-layer homology domain-containing protein [Bacillota bacterium]